MLRTRLASASPALHRFIWCYGQSEGHINENTLIVPLPARPKQVLTFFFRDRYRVHLCKSGQCDTSPRTIVVGPQTYHRLDLHVSGSIDVFTIHFQPCGFHYLFGVPMAELRDETYDAHVVLGGELLTLEQQLSETSSFTERIQITEKYLVGRLRNARSLDAVGIVANKLFANKGGINVAAMAASSGITQRHFERRFLEQVGVPPKLYARIIRFNAAIDRKLAFPDLGWTQIAHDLNYYDQMHMVHDFQVLAGDSPSRFLTKLKIVPAFHTAFATRTHPQQPVNE